MCYTTHTLQNLFRIHDELHSNSQIKVVYLSVVPFMLTQEVFNDIPGFIYTRGYDY